MERAGASKIEPGMERAGVGELEVEDGKRWHCRRPRAEEGTQLLSPCVDTVLFYRRRQEGSTLFLRYADAFDLPVPSRKGWFYC
uniref:Uncharacterized protein n=1 Tax=Triticum urartu TaxID=4572 RepID=A0A8R7QF14_TRIUA